MASLICDTDLIATHFQGLSFLWEALRMNSYVRWSVTVVFSSIKVRVCKRDTRIQSL